MSVCFIIYGEGWGGDFVKRLEKLGALISDAPQREHVTQPKEPAPFYFFRILSVEKKKTKKNEFYIKNWLFWSVIDNNHENRISRRSSFQSMLSWLEELALQIESGPCLLQQKLSIN